MAAARKVITDSSGRFVYRDLAKGPYALTAMKPGYVSGNYGKFVPLGPGSSLELADGERLIDVRINVCALALELLGTAQEDFDPLIDDVQGVASFFADAGDAITFI